jgi:hypothetical protein
MSTNSSTNTSTDSDETDTLSPGSDSLLKVHSLHMLPAKVPPGCQALSNFNEESEDDKIGDETLSDLPVSRIHAPTGRQRLQPGYLVAGYTGYPAVLSPGILSDIGIPMRPADTKRSSRPPTGRDIASAVADGRASLRRGSAKSSGRSPARKCSTSRQPQATRAAAAPAAAVGRQSSAKVEADRRFEAELAAWRADPAGRGDQLHTVAATRPQSPPPRAAASSPKPAGSQPRAYASIAQPIAAADRSRVRRRR